MAVVPFACPACQAAMNLPDNLPAGRAYKCPRCGKLFVPPVKPAPAAPVNTHSSLVGEGSQQEATEGQTGAYLEDPAPNSDPLTSFLAPPQKPDELGGAGPYRVLAILGQGGMGVVFKAEDPVLRRAVALKVMLPQVASNPTAKARFLREPRRQAAVEHDHVIAIHLVSEDRGVPFLAMPLLKGTTLAEPLKQNARPPIHEVLRIGREMAEGLAAAHERGLIHRDIKPGNVWLEGSKRRVKILDFGLARSAAVEAEDSDYEPITRQGATVGTPAYMSPEQARGDPVDPRTDLFSLGVVLYQMATGELPFRGRDVMAILMSLAVDTPAPPLKKNPDVPPALSELILRLLAKTPAGRPATAEAVAEEIRRIEESLTRLPVIVSTAAAVVNDPWADIDATEASEVVHVPTRASGTAKRMEKSAPASAGGGRKTALIAAGGLAVVLAIGAGLMLSGGKKPADGGPRPVVEAGKPPRPGNIPTPSQPITPPPALAAIDLLDRAEPSRDSAQGHWVRQGSDIVGGGDGKVVNVLELPYRPGDEYDFEVEFTRTYGNSGVSLALTHAGRSFEWGVSVGGRHYGFGDLNGLNVGDRPETAHTDLKLENDRRYITRVEVRRDRVIGYLDGTKINELKTDFSNLDMPGSGRLRDATLLGLKTSSNVSVVFHRARVWERTGQGSFTRLAPAASPDLEAVRKAATWVLKTGGKVEIRKDAKGGSSTIAAVADLPGDFLLHVITLGPQVAAGFEDGAEAFRGVSANRWDKYARVDAHATLTDDGLGRLAALPMLGGVKYLVLSNTKITDAGLASLRELPLLSNLSIGGTSITGAGFVHLKGLTGLRILSVPNCRLEKAHLLALADLRLGRLNLDPNPTFDDAFVEPLSRLTSLRELDVLRTPMTAEGVKRLAAALPACTIHSPHGDFPGKPPLEVARPTLDWLLKVGILIEIETGGKFIQLKSTDKLPPDALLSNLHLWHTSVKLTQPLTAELAVGLKDLPASAWSEKQVELETSCYSTVEGWKALAEVPGLRFISSIRIINIASNNSMASLTGFQHLSRLELLMGRFNDEGLLAAPTLPALRELIIDKTPFITGACLKPLAGLPLTELSIEQCVKIGDEAVEPLSLLRSLKKLNCSKTAFTAEGVKKLAEALPGCRIVSDHGTFEPRPVPAADERKAAEVLHKYAKLGLRLTANQKHAAIATGEPLPAEPFAVTDVHFLAADLDKHHAKVMDEVFPALTGLRSLGTLTDSSYKLGLIEAHLTQLADSPAAQSLHALKPGGLRLTLSMMDTLKRFPGLAHLDVSIGGANDAPLLRLKELTALDSLNLQNAEGAKITSAGVAAIAGLRLKRFSIGVKGSLDREWGRSIAALPSLERLILHPATDEVLAEIARCPKLRTLLIQHSALTDAGLQNLKGSASLRSLDLTELGDSKVTEAGVKHLAAALPRCKISWSGGIIQPTDKPDPLLPMIPDEPEAMTDDRKAAEELHKYAKLGLSLNATQKHIATNTGDPLPAEPFTLTHVVFLQTDRDKHHAKVMAEVLPFLVELRSLETFRDESFRVGFTDVGFGRLAGSPVAESLRSLKIGTFKFSPSVLDALKRFPKLTHLDVSILRADDALVARFKELPLLDSLDLQMTEEALITAKGVAAITGLPLKTLSISVKGPLERDWSRGIAAMPNLDRLLLHFCSDDSLADLARCPKLRTLQFQHSALSDAGLQHLKASTSLRSLNLMELGDSTVTEAGVKQLAAALPKCRIVWKGGTIEASVKSNPLPAAKPDEPMVIADPDRKAAEALHAETDLDLVLADGKKVKIKPAEPLPAGPFRLVRIGFAKSDQKIGKDYATSVLLPAVADLTALESIHDSYGVMEFGEENFERLSRLPAAATITEFALNFSLTPRSLEALARCSALRDFGCGFADANDDLLAGIGRAVPHLKGIGLNYLANRGAVSAKGIAALTALPLTRLGLMGSKRVDEEFCQAIAKMPDLDYLMLYLSSVADDDLQALARCPKLWQLDLGETAVTDAGLKHLRAFPRLTSLRLQGKQVTDAGLEQLAGVTKLNRVNLRKTKVTEAGVKKLAAALPKCRIEWDGGEIVPMGK